MAAEALGRIGGAPAASILPVTRELVRCRWPAIVRLARQLLTKEGHREGAQEPR